MNKLIELENLTNSEVIKAVATVKKGIYHIFTRKHEEKNGYYFIKSYTGHLGSYAVASGKDTNTIKASPNQITIIENVLYYNTNTNNYLLKILSTNNDNHRTKASYYDNNGKEISKQEYEMVNPPKKTYSKDKPIMFTIKLNELISIK